ncbi:MAG: tyrosine-type recombinase/integrase [Sphingomonadaceae bacterium]|nr:tyrosine-type recombinase/integrase [Sphingomonadaceae bacterium]
MRRLSASAVKTAKQPGRVGDGDGLFLLVKASGAKSWVCRVQRLGRRRDFGLGSANTVSLAVARERAREVRSWVALGLDPVFERRKARGIPTFREAAAKVLAAQKKGWRNAKHQDQWLSTLEAYAFPYIGSVTVDEISGPMIRDLLAPIWLTKPETARRVRQRVGTILDWAYASGYRTSEAPMRAVTKGLPKQPRKDGHFAAMPYDRVAGFMVRLRSKASFSRLALEFLILTAARSGEVRGAAWKEIDIEAATWTIAAARMKGGREHVVPLSSSALALLRRCAELKQVGTDLVFPGAKIGQPLSDMTLSKLMKEMGEPYTVHGFRSAFRDWVSEETDYPGEIAEAALAHAIPNKTEAAYRRGKLLVKRRSLMADWAGYCVEAKT